MREELDMTVVGCLRSFALTLAYGFQTVEIPNLGMSVAGWEHPFADLGVHSILTVEIPSRGMTGTE